MKHTSHYTNGTPRIQGIAVEKDIKQTFNRDSISLA